MGLEKILAVIVLYKSSLKESASFKSLLESVCNYEANLTVLIYNNSPGYWAYDYHAYGGLNIIYVEDQLNPGVSKAYNTAYKKAKSLNKDYVFILDQDTTFQDNLFKSFFEFEQRFKNNGVMLYCPMMMNKNELLSPAKFFIYTSKKLPYITPGIQPLKGLSVINSGLIISTTLFDLVGGYNERIRLDFSDFDFLKRSLKFTKNIVVLNVKCQHDLSAENDVLINSALARFDNYLDGAMHFEKSFITSIGLNIWILLRSVKLDIKYKTINFTKKTISQIIKVK